MLNNFSALWADIKAKKVEVLVGISTTTVGICAILVALYLENKETVNFITQENSDQSSVIPDTLWTAIDGDTIKSSEEYTVELYGIDAPELRQLCYTDSNAWACGKRSKQELQMFINNKQIECKFMFIDRYGRNVENCTIDGKSIGEYMLENGWASVRRDYRGVRGYRYDDGKKHIEKYTQIEEQSKKNQLGIWSADCVRHPGAWKEGFRCRQ